MKNFAGMFGWLLLTAVLAVPSVLFYNWWSTNKAKEAQLAAAQQGVPRGFFPGEEKPAGETSASPSGPQPLVTPDQPAADSETAPPPANGPDVPPARPVAPEVSAVPEIPAGVSPDLQASTAAAGAAGAGAGSPAPGDQKSASYFAPKTSRNPFLTPDDYARIREEEMRRRQEARDKAQQARQTQREVLVESRMNIQGIVGANVIINGEMYSRGDTILGAKIIAIGSNYIIGEHKGRRFRKYMQ